MRSWSMRAAILGLLLAAGAGVAGADTLYFWRYREHATDCTALTDGKAKDLCKELDSDHLFACEPASGGETCDTAAEWVQMLAQIQTDPASCSAGTFVTDMNASGTLTCSQVPLASGVSGTLPIANGGTGATTLADLIALATHTTGNYISLLGDCSTAENASCFSGTSGRTLTFEGVSGLSDVELRYDATTDHDFEITDDLNILDVGPHLSLDPTTGSTYGLHVEPSSSNFFISDETNAIFLLHFRGASKAMTFGAAQGGGTSQVAWYEYVSDGTGNGEVRLPADSIGVDELDTADSPADAEALTYQALSGRMVWAAAASGDIEGVTAGTGLSGGGTSGTVTVSLATPVAIANGGTNATSFGSAQIVYFDGTRLVTTTDGSLNWTGGQTGGGGVTMETPDDGTAWNAKILATQANVTAADTYIEMRSNTGIEADISGTAAAGVIAYNTFTGSHYTRITDKTGLFVGAALCATGEALPDDLGRMVRGKLTKRSSKQQLVTSRICTAVQDSAVWGVYGGTNKQGDDLVLAIGTGLATVSNKGLNVAIGDYLVSSDVKGQVERQSTAFLMNYTVAKALEPIVWNVGETAREIAVTYHGG